MKSIHLLLSFVLLLVCSTLVAVHTGLLAAAVLLFVGTHILSPSAWHRSARLCTPTLTSTEILQDIIKAFAKAFPALNRMGLDFRPQSLKLNQQYIAHIPTLPSISTYDTGTGYANGATLARSLLVDVPITVDTHKHVPLKWLHLDAIKDQKNRYEEVMSNTGYVLAKAFVDDLLSGVTTNNFSQEAVYATADCDLDMLIAGCGAMNAVGALPSGRVLFVNTAVANVLSSDSRLTSALFYDQRPGGNALRSWTNIAGWALIQEYADFPSNNATALTGVTGANAGDLMTKTAHGLLTGDPVTFVSGTTFTGLTAGTKYYAIKATADTFQVALTNAAAIAGTAVVLSADGTSGVFQKTENLAAFGFDMRAFAALAGIPDAFDSPFLASLNIPRIMGLESITEATTGISMAAVSWQEAGTGNLFYSPTMVWGKSLGRQGGANAVGAKCDYAGLRIITA